MKPHASNHHVLHSPSNAGIDLSALGAGKDSAMTSADGPGFASIMAQQRASATDASVNAADSQLTVKAEPAEVGTTESQQAAPIELVQQMSPDMLVIQPQQSQITAARSSNEGETALQNLPIGAGGASSVMNQHQHFLPNESPDFQASSIAFKGVKPELTSMVTDPLTANVLEPSPIQLSSKELQLPDRAGDQALKQVKALTSSNAQVDVEKSALHGSQLSGASMQPALTLASMLANSPEVTPSTIDTFGLKPKILQSMKSDLQRSTVDKAFHLKNGSPETWPGAMSMPTGIYQPTEVMNNTLLADKLSSAFAGTEGGVTDAKQPMDKPSDSIPAWVQSNVLIPVKQAEAMANETAVMRARVGSAEFADEFVGQVNVWVKKAADTGTLTAELRLNPAEMGPVQIRIEMDGSNAQVSFVAQHLETRQAIEASMSSLSTTLQEAGIQLSGSGVSDQSSHQQASSGFGSRSDDAPRPWQTPQQVSAGDMTNNTPKAFLDEAEPWVRPRAGQNASGLDLYA